MKESRLKAAVISAGMIANAAHIPAWKSIPELAELVAVCDLNPAAAEGAAKRHGIARWYTDAEEMLKKERPDVVSVCTPNMLHKPMTLLALSQGCHVACEKPVALTYADAKEMYDYAARQGRALVACQTLRYNDEYRFAREMAENGTLGEVYYAEFSLIRRRGVPKWGVFHKKDANGGGAFCDLGVHMVDAALWCMGGRAFEAVSGLTSDYLSRHEGDILTSLAESGAPAGVHNARPYSPAEFEVEEFAAGAIRLTGGALLNFKTSWAVNLPNEYGMRLAGTKAGVALPEMKLFSTMGRYQADIQPRCFAEGKHAGKDFMGHYYLMENVARHILHGEALMVQPAETLNVMAIIDAFYRSAAERREVRASEIL
ncbi:MAG: Gfo/Idh/MocA family oxidoreductase, partial [Clostridia bacterium]|nr:Gfo/Idh/MocA family oxidoreductase [Clostridia bacterium]